jgi:ATP-dependent DNA helicase RecG
VAAGHAELQELYNAFGFVMTEEQVVPGTRPADIVDTEFEVFLRRQGLDLLSEPRLSLEDDLRNRGVLAPWDEQLGVTLFGLLCFGRNPQGHAATRSFWIEAVAYAGPDRASEVLLTGEGKGRLPEQVDWAMAWARGLGKRETYEGVIRHDEWIVPLDALREILVNAVVHRDYAVLGSKVLFEVFADRVVW